MSQSEKKSTPPKQFWEEQEEKRVTVGGYFFLLVGIGLLVALMLILFGNEIPWDFEYLTLVLVLACPGLLFTFGGIGFAHAREWGRRTADFGLLFWLVLFAVDFGSKLADRALSHQSEEPSLYLIYFIYIGMLLAIVFSVRILVWGPTVLSVFAGPHVIYGDRRFSIAVQTLLLIFAVILFSFLWNFHHPLQPQ